MEKIPFDSKIRFHSQTKMYKRTLSHSQSPSPPLSLSLSLFRIFPFYADHHDDDGQYQFNKHYGMLCSKKKDRNNMKKCGPIFPLKFIIICVYACVCHHKAISWSCAQQKICASRTWWSSERARACCDAFAFWLFILTMVILVFFLLICFLQLICTILIIYNTHLSKYTLSCVIIAWKRAGLKLA